MPDIKNIPGVNVQKYNAIKAYWNLSPGIWLSLILSWLIVFVSFLLSFEIPASGAVLVCGALVSEILFEKLRWRKLPCTPEGTFYLVAHSFNDEPAAQNEHWVASVTKGENRALLSLTPETLFDSNHRNETTWHYREIVEKIENIILIFIIGSAILGTLLWGYGEKYFNNCA